VVLPKSYFSECCSFRAALAAVDYIAFHIETEQRLILPHTGCKEIKEDKKIECLKKKGNY